MQSGGRPCFSLNFSWVSSSISATLAEGLARVPRGEVSVMPQAWVTSTPNSSRKPRTMASGTAEPPITTRLRVESLPPVWRRWVSSICQTVGTAAEKVTFSDSSSSCTEAPSSFGPGMTSLAPTAGAEKAMPQALAWNMGTTGRTVSIAPMPMTSTPAVTRVCRKFDRWE